MLGSPSTDFKLNGIHVKGDQGHNELFFMDEFKTSYICVVPVFSDTL